MNTIPHWNELKSAYQPATPPVLDTDAIMAAVRKEAGAKKRLDFPLPFLRMPTWACAAAAAVAMMCTVSLTVNSVSDADQQIVSAWYRQSIQPAELTQLQLANLFK